MSKSKLLKEEQELLDALETGQFELVLTDSRREELEAIAGNTSKKDKRINIRISNRDLTTSQSRAARNNLAEVLRWSHCC